MRPGRRRGLADLTAAMGIRSASLYKAFGDKGKLFREVVDAYAATPTAQFVRQAFDEERSARAAFARMLRDAAVRYTDPAHPPGCLVITAATNITEQDAAIETFLRDLRAANRATLRDRLAAAERDGELPDDTDIDALADYFAVVIQGMSQRARDGADSAALLTVADLAMAVWPEVR
ncbi:TetR/AcrR family transcriptional regulator [Nocardia terpenica]|uniref:TetR/AcrR family transcriptional regulator n=2 Tax=Nocardia terpenica TaxID=455432 RepID=A0A6G9Z2Q1_9NOCA|nr:TetR/AcrR family transcriptional regulator [Nocardia terpenica]